MHIVTFFLILAGKAFGYLSFMTKSDSFTSLSADYEIGSFLVFLVCWVCHECTLTSVKCLLCINKNHLIILLNYGKVLNFIVWFLNVKRFSNISQSVSSVAPSCPTLCDPMNHSTPGLPVHHQLSEFTQTHVHQIGDAIQPSQPLLSPSPPAPNPSQQQGLFQWVNSSHQVAKLLEFQHQSFQWISKIDFL